MMMMPNWRGSLEGVDYLNSGYLDPVQGITSKRVQSMNKRVKAMNKRVKAMDKRVKAMDKRVKAMDTRVKSYG